MHTLLERTAVLTHCLPGVAVEPEGRCGVRPPTGMAFGGSGELSLAAWGPRCSRRGSSALPLGQCPAGVAESDACLRRRGWCPCGEGAQGSEAQGSVQYKSLLWVVVSPEDADALSPELTGPSGKLACEAPFNQGDMVLEGWGGGCPVTSRGKRGMFGPGHRGRVCGRGQRRGGAPNCPPPTAACLGREL